MGKSKKGEGGDRRSTTEQVVRSLLRRYSQDSIEVASITVQRVTDNLYSAEILEHGQHEPEAFFLKVEDQ